LALITSYLMRVFTCTPVAFGGGPDFFARDSGLLCRGLQSLGIESRAIMPGEAKASDEPDLIRTAYANLESAAWWRDQRIDALVLYAWGRPKFRKVARAIHEAGIFLILNQDNGGFISPLAGWRGWLQEKWIMSGQGVDLRSWLRFLISSLKESTLGLLITDPLRASHLKDGDIIACVSPQAADVYQRLCNRYGGRDLASKVRVIPHAVEPIFHDSGATRLRQIICVGRWSDIVQKRQNRMMEVFDRLLALDRNVSLVIAGEITNALRDWHASLIQSEKSRVKLVGRLDRSALAKMMAESQVFYSPSAYESFGIAAAEALCSGCSVVAHRSVSMASFEWFVSEKSGTLANEDSTDAHLMALTSEIEAWDKSHRNASSISEIWRKRLHADQVAREVVKLLPNRLGGEL
jgi:glycosyltransferase involved in cell wall biosynthesis